MHQDAKQDSNCGGKGDGTVFCSYNWGCKNYLKWVLEIVYFEVVVMPCALLYVPSSRPWS